MKVSIKHEGREIRVGFPGEGRRFGEGISDQEITGRGVEFVRKDRPGCRECGSRANHFRLRTAEYVCHRCGNIWKEEPPPEATQQGEISEVAS